MLNMPIWEWGLLAVGAYVAIMALTRLMKAKRQELVQELSLQVLAEKARQAEIEKQAKVKKRGKKGSKKAA